MPWRLLVAGALILVGIAAVGLVVFGPPGSASDRTQFLTAAVVRTDVVQQAVATGSVTARATYGLSFGNAPQLVDADASNGSSGNGSSGGTSTATWRTLSVRAKVGDVVKAGQLLATADSPDLRQQYEAATASWRAASIQRTVAQDTLDDASGTDQVRQATIGLYNAEAQLSQAAKTRADLRVEIGRARIVAPADGIVTAVNVTAGVDAPSGDAIQMEVSPLQVSADFAESDLPALSPGQAATVTIAAVGKTVIGKVAAITPVASSSGSSSVVTYTVTIALDQAPAEIRSGMSADVSVATASATSVLAIPSIALNGTSGNYTVRVLTSDGQVETRAVQVGLTTSSLTEIKSGLNPGEEVITGTASARQNATGGLGTGLGGGFPGGVRGQGQGQGQGGGTRVPAP